MEADLLAGSVFRRGVGSRAAETGEDSTSLAFELNSKLHELQQAWETPPKGSAFLASSLFRLSSQVSQCIN